MKPIKLKEWALLIILTVTSFCLWHKFAYPHFTFINFSIDREEAVAIAQKNLATFEPEMDKYATAIVLRRERAADRYLQKTLGFDGLLEFIQKHDFDMFIWDVRFFQEEKEEEYRFYVSPATGEVVHFIHKIEDTRALPIVSKEALLERSKSFLKDRFGFEEHRYQMTTDLGKKLPHRKDYVFSWDKRDVQIPWSQDPATNAAFFS